MNGTRIISVLALAMAVTAGAFASTSYAPGQVLVKFKPSSTTTQLLAHKAIGAFSIANVPQLGIQKIQLRSGMSVEQAVRFYRGLPYVQYAEPNYIVRADYVPNDPLYNGQYAPQKIKMPAAWDLSLGNSNVKIAVIDTGVDYNHPDLAGKVIKGKDYANGDADPMDDNGHGTHCAGNAAAKTNNGVGIAGIGFNCTILAEKVLGADGSGLASDTTQAILDAADAGVDVISMSLGSAGESQAEHDAVDYAWSKGVVVVAAAGNDGVATHHFPGAFENCICVGATDSNDVKADFSNFGADWVDVAAPGVDINSTFPNNTYGLDSGTSMSTPIVAGLAGLMKSYSPTSSNSDIRAAIEANCDNIGTWVSKGRVNGFSAVNALIVPFIVNSKVNALSIYRAGTFTQGTSLAGTTDNLTVNDNKMVSVKSVLQPNVAYVSSVQTNLPVNVTSVIRSADLQFSANVPTGITLQVFLKKNGTYTLVKSYPGSGSLTNYDLPVMLPASYISNNTFSVVIRGYRSLTGHGPTSHTLAMDMLQLHMLVNPN